MDFSILITVYHKDNPKYLQEALESIRIQTVAPSEIIIVEDGPISSDLKKVILDFKDSNNCDIKILSLPENIGTGLAMNEGIKACSYDLIAKMDSDDISYPDRFEKQLRIFENNPEISFVSAYVAEFVNDNKDNVISYRILPEKHEDILSYARKRCPLNQPVVMYKKSAVLACDGYKKFTFGEDYDLWVRALLKGYKFYNIQEPLLYFRSNTDTIKKRGDFWYLKIDLSHHYDFYKMGFLTLPQFLYNSLIRIVVRLSPLKLRRYIYNKLLRSNK